jgi:hypothetical protein
VSPVVLSGELNERYVLKNTVINAFKSSDFKKLESMADMYRSQETKTSSGVWKLTFYYFGLSDYAHWTTRYPNSIWKQAKINTEDWIKAYPTSPAPYIAQSILLDSLAYSQITRSKKGKTTSGDINRFKEIMKQNLTFLLDNKKIAAKDPHWYVNMIRVATALKWDEPKYMHLVDEAVENYPLYLQIYFAGVDYYSPKFGGNIKSMEKFARYAVKHTQDKIGMAMYARIYWAAIQSWFRKEVWAVIHWDDFKQGIDDVLSHYPDEWNLNNFALFACLKGDSEKANELITQLTSEPLLQVWRNKENFNQCKSAVTTI